MDKSEVEELFPEVREIQNAGVREKTARVLAEFISQGKWEAPADLPLFLDIPASRFDTVEHLRAVAQASLALGKVVEDVLGIDIDHDHLVAAALLHDASKWCELDPVDGPDGVVISETGSTLPHPSAAAVRCAEVGLPGDVVQAIASHTPSNTFPTSTPIAAIVHHVDLALNDCCRLAAGFTSMFKLIQS